MIDRSRTYYRVVHARDGYMSDAEESFDPSSGLARSDFTDLEFETLEGVGRWLFLGTEIQSLRIPEDANIELNSPMGQGGCYAYSSDKFQVLEALSIADWLTRLPERYEGSLHVRDIELPLILRFPSCWSLQLENLAINATDCFREEVDAIRLHHVSFANKTGLPGRLKELRLLGVDPGDLVFPETLTSLSLDHCESSAPLDLSSLKSLEDLQIEACAFEIVKLPASLKQVRVLHQPSTEFLHFDGVHPEARFTFVKSPMAAPLRDLLQAGGSSLMEIP